MTTSKNIDVDGEIDASFSSYGVPKQDSSDMNGEINTDYLPEGVDESDLTELEREIIETATGNPTLSTVEIAENVDCHNSTVGRKLREYLPEWYEAVFKETGGSMNTGPGNGSDSDDSEDTETDTDESTVGVDHATTRTVEEPEQPDMDTLKDVIEAMKATAQFDETKDALEVVEGYL